jgi:hypothetical protein
VQWGGVQRGRVPLVLRPAQKEQQQHGGCWPPGVVGWCKRVALWTVVCMQSRSMAGITQPRTLLACQVCLGRAQQPQAVTNKSGMLLQSHAPTSGAA